MRSLEVQQRETTRIRQCSCRLASFLWVVGIVAFLLSIASPYDDGFQQEVFRPKSFHVAVRRLPSATNGTRKGGAVTQLLVATVVNATVMPMALRDVEPDTATLLAICFRTSLTLRSPPPIR